MKKVFPTFDCLLKVISGSIKTVVQTIIGVLSFIIDKSNDCFFQMICLLGLMIRQPLSSFSRVVIIGALMNTHSVHDDPVPCPEPWAGS